MTVTSRDTFIFKDLDLDFLLHPLSKDVSTKLNDNAIKQALKILLLTNHYERPFHSEIGCSIRDQLFENITPLTRHMIKRSIQDVITNYEPRVDIRDISVDDYPDENSIRINIEFSIKNTSKISSVDIILEKTR